MLVGSVTTMLLASSEAHTGQAKCLRRDGDPNSVGTGNATGGATIDMKDGASQRAAGRQTDAGDRSGDP